MKKIWKSIISFILVIVMCVNMVSCNWFLLGAGTVIGGALFYDEYQNNDEFRENLEEIWDYTSGNLEEWWEYAGPEINEWYEYAKETGLDIYNATAQQIQNVGEFISSKSTELVDDVVTQIASNIRQNNLTQFNGVVPSGCETTFTSTIEISDDENDYTYNADTFAYNLVIATLPEGYEFIPVSFYSSEAEMHGIAYTNFGEYVVQDGIKYYACGVLLLPGQLPLSETEKGTAFVLKADENKYHGSSSEGLYFQYVPESFYAHCVALGKYFVFGVNDSGEIDYTYTDYDYNSIRSDLGELYSFDTNSVIKYEGEYSHFTSSPFMASVKNASRTTSEIKSDLYNSFSNYTLDFSQFSADNLKNIFNTAKTSISNFMSTIGKSTNTIKDMTFNDLVGMKIFSKDIPQEATDREKWVVGTGTFMVIIATVVITSVIRHSNPTTAAKLGVKSAAIIAMAMEAFAQVVLQSTSVEDIDGRKVAIAAIAGAISANMGLVGDSIVGGLVEGVYALIDGESFENIIESVCQGVIIGFALGLAIHVVCKVVAFSTSKVSKLLKSQKTKVLSVASSADDYASALYATKRATKNCAVGKAAYAYKDEFLKKLPKPYPAYADSYYRYVDEFGNYIDHKTINGFIELTENAPSSLRKAWTDRWGNQVTRLKIDNATIDFLEVARESIRLEHGLTSNSITNLSRADKQLLETWQKQGHVSKWAEDSVNDYLAKHGKSSILDLTTKDMEYFSFFVWFFSWHETVGGMCNLVPQNVNNPGRGYNGIGHAGGISVYKKAASYDVNPQRLFQYIQKYRFVT